MRLSTPPWRERRHIVSGRARGAPASPGRRLRAGLAACSAEASGYVGAVTFDEKPAAALVPGDQVVERDGSQLARADLRTIARVERNGGDLVW